MATLLDLSADMRFVMVQLERVEEAQADPARVEEVEETRKFLVAQLADGGVKMAEKVDGYVCIYRELEALAEARKAEAKHLLELARSAENRAAWLRERVIEAARILDVMKLVGKTRTITISQGAPAYEVKDEMLVPGEYKVEIPATWRIDKRLIAEHVKETGEVPAGIMAREVVRVVFR